MKVTQLLNQIDNDVVVLPVFQRGFVWSKSKILHFLSSLYNNYPIGSLLIWETETATNKKIIRNQPRASRNYYQIIIDGQQRVTTIYAVARGKMPPFFIGDSTKLQDIYFDIENEKFEYLKKTANPNPFCVNVTEILINGTDDVLNKIYEELSRRFTHDEVRELDRSFRNRLDKLYKIREKQLVAEPLTDDRLTTQDILKIFIAVNSGNKKLTGGDLALASVCAKRHTARKELQKILDEWTDKGFKFSLAWLLRNVNACTTGEAKFDNLDSLSSSRFKKGLNSTKKYIEDIIYPFQLHLGIDNDKLLGMRACIPIFVRYFAINSGNVTSDAKAKLLYWYLHTVINQRYYGATESILSKDLQSLSTVNEHCPLTNLLNDMQKEGNPKKVKWPESYGARANNRYFQLQYILTRVSNARDLLTNHPLNFSGFQQPLERHHISPSSLLTKSGYSQKDANDTANFAFLTKKSNRKISNKLPEEYLSEREQEFPKILSKQWIPKKRDLWRIENYHRFLLERRRLLSRAANKLLTDLEAGILPQP